MVRLVLSAGPSGASDWVGNQDVYDTAGGIISLWIVASSDHSVRMTLLLEGLGDTILINRVTYRSAD